MNRFEQAAEEALTTRAEMARLVAKFDIRWAVDPSLRFPASEADCPPIGWAGLVEKLVHELLRRGWDRKLTEANEKLGVLRFEIDGDADGFLDLPKLTRYMLYNKWTYRDEDAGVMKKCTLCVDRIYNEHLPEEDRQPACVLAN